MARPFAGAGIPWDIELALAIDVGGTKLAAGLVTAEGDLLASATTPTPDTDDPEELYSVLEATVDRARANGDTGPERPLGAGDTGPERPLGAGDTGPERPLGAGDTGPERSLGAGDTGPERPLGAGELDIAVVGVGCGGPMSAGGEDVSPLNIPAWEHFPLRPRLARSTGVATFVDNDAKALALGEGWRGAAAGCSDYLAMVVSTGVGGGIVLDGRLLDGAAGNAGHIGHVIVEPHGRRCGCGARGCLEAEASGSAIAAVTGRAAAEAGAETVARTGTLVGRAVASVANLLDLRLAVVAGSVALGFGEPFFAAAQAEVDARARLAFSRRTRIVPAGLGTAGPLVGAAAVGWRGLGRL